MKVTRWLRLCSKLLLMLLGITTLSQSVHAYYIIRRVGLLSTCGYQDIQSAIDNVKTVNGVTGVNILVDAKYVYNQSLTINGKNVNITGGFADCTETTPSYGAPSVLKGVSSASVINIEGTSNVTLSGLDISGGQGTIPEGATRSDGGGVFFNGSGNLTIINSKVHGNNATDSGGGIAVYASGATTMVLDSQSVVSGNNASGLGGGIFVEGPVDAYLNGAIGDTNDMNAAVSGGGVAARGSDNGSPMVYLYSTTTSLTARISGNIASSFGGGIYLYPLGAHASLCAQDFAIDSNTASDGAAIYAVEDDTGSTSSIYLNYGGCTIPTDAAPAIHCGHAGQFCNEIDDNIANGSPYGGTVTVETGFVFQGERFEAMGNSGSSLLSDFNAVSLVNCLLAENTETLYLIDVQAYDSASTQLNIEGCTIAKNTEGSGYTIHSGVNEIKIYNSIFSSDDGSEAITFINANHSLDANFVLTGDSDDSLGMSFAIAHGIPTFLAIHDYHLSPNSLGVDFAPLLTSDADLDGRQRDVDLANIVNKYGTVDLGAYEIQNCGASDTIFCSTFE